MFDATRKSVSRNDVMHALCNNSNADSVSNLCFLHEFIQNSCSALSTNTLNIDTQPVERIDIGDATSIKHPLWLL